MPIFSCFPPHSKPFWQLNKQHSMYALITFLHHLPTSIDAAANYLGYSNEYSAYQLIHSKCVLQPSVAAHEQWYIRDPSTPSHYMIQHFFLKLAITYCIRGSSLPAPLKNAFYLLLLLIHILIWTYIPNCKEHCLKAKTGRKRKLAGKVNSQNII